MKSNILLIAKGIWVVAIFSAIGLYFVNHLDMVGTQILDLSFSQLILSFSFLVLGKILLSEAARRSVACAGWIPPFSRMLYIYTSSQLAKYLPGGIWHFVGRARLYRANGLALSQAGRAIAVENVWLIVSALFIGTIASLSYFTGIPSDIIGLKSPLHVVWIILLLFAIWFGALMLIARFLVPADFKHNQSVPFVFLLQIGIWFSLGMSLWALFPESNGYGLISLAIGGFSLGWVIGYVTPFAPAGLGVREVGIVAIIAIAIPAQDAAFLAAANRLIWTVTELTLSVVAYLFVKHTSGQTVVESSNHSEEPSSKIDKNS